jgi:hypothetical protein
MQNGKTIWRVPVDTGDFVEHLLSVLSQFQHFKWTLDTGLLPDLGRLLGEFCFMPKLLTKREQIGMQNIKFNLIFLLKVFEIIK